MLRWLYFQRVALCWPFADGPMLGGPSKSRRTSRTVVTTRCCPSPVSGLSLTPLGRDFGKYFDLYCSKDSQRSLLGLLLFMVRFSDQQDNLRKSADLAAAQNSACVLSRQVHRPLKSRRRQLVRPQFQLTVKLVSERT